jgi:Sec23/Sec24 zinc finger
MDCAGDFAYFSESRYINKADSNVIEISLGCLKQGSNLATGDPVYCNQCRSLLSALSHLIRTDQCYVWKCEFCGSSNEVVLEEEELPKDLELTYILESAAQMSRKFHDAKDNAIIFCIDISGSMCVSKPVSGILNLKTSRQQELMKLIMPGEEEQYFPGSNKNITYVSRLECVQAAIESQLQELYNTSPNRKVGIVAFNGDVKIIGDGNNQDILTGDRLFDFEQIKKYFEDKKNYYLTRSICDTIQTLKRKVFELEETGPTALGPALLASLLLAAEDGPGSKVIICTDGLANVGLGSLETGQSGDFYSLVGSMAAEKGVSVSIISIEGDECRLESLSSVTEASGGEIMRVAPENLSEQFANILSDSVIATHVTVEVTLQKSLMFRDEDPLTLSLQSSRLQKKVGNAVSSSSFSFKYTFKSDEELNAIGVDKLALDFVHMQAVFTYKSLEGMKCIRVINRKQPVTFDKQQAKRNVKIEMLARAGRREAARCAEQGRFNDAKIAALEWRKALNEQEIKLEKDLQHVERFQTDLMDLEAEMDELDQGVVQIDYMEKPKECKQEYQEDYHIESINSRLESLDREISEIKNIIEGENRSARTEMLAELENALSDRLRNKKELENEITELIVSKSERKRAVSDKLVSKVNSMKKS